MRPTTSRRRVLPAALALLLAACSTSGGTAADDTTTTAPASTTTRPRTTTTDDETTTTVDEGPNKAELEAFIETVLLAPEDTGVDAMVASTPRLSRQAPCGLDLARDFPPVGMGNVTLTADEKGLTVQEVIRVYATERDAAAAFEAVLDTGLGCPESTDGSIKIVPVGDVSANITPPGVELEAEGFDLDSADFQGSAYVIHYSDALVVIQFLSQPGAAELGALPETDDVAKAALAKIDASVPD